MAISRSGIDNSKVQEMIAQKLESGAKDAEGNLLSRSAIMAEFARVLLKSGKKQDEIDWLVYGKDNS